MTIKLHNTLTRREEDFRPIDPDNVRLYVCGPTVYDLAHIGNARPAVVFDVLYRLLTEVYGKEHVTYARNITDVDDKIIKASLESGEPIESITKRTTQAYHEDMGALGCLPPTVEPRCTGHIPEMVAMIQVLIDKGTMKDYGGLSRRSLDEMVAGARVEVADYKRNPQDFVLWKPAKDDEPGWDSPWGKGRPGWHIECSAMAEKHLGKLFDIHGGGLDLIFPHHENEIAQTRCVHDSERMANYWVHNGYVVVNGEKMSKSLGNFFTVRQLLEEGWDGEVIRLSLLSGHYRQPLDITREKLASSKAQLDRWYGALRQAEALERASARTTEGVLEALQDDLNTPEAIARLHAAADRLFQGGEGAEQAKALLLDGGWLLGFCQRDPEAWFQGGGDDAEAAEIQSLIDERIAARKAKDFARADAIRDELTARGIQLEDGPQGTTWKRA
ncbi:MAG: cysteine--tRNA ligase [Limibacillus sp.]